MLLWTTSLVSLQVLEGFYGTYLATEVAYYTYIYAKVGREHFPKVTSHTRAAIFSGRFIAATIAQILVFFKIMDYRQLNYITLATQICATVWAVTLPSVNSSLYFNRQTENTSLVKKNVNNTSIRNAFQLLWSHFKVSYSNKRVLQWSFWYALAMAGYIQIYSYCQLLWEAVDDREEYNWNGAVEAVSTLLGAIVSLLAGYIHNEALTQRRSLWILTIFSILEGCCLLLCSWATHRLVAYTGYLLFMILYSFLITIASAEVAKNLKDDSYGLIFGINTLVALIMQSILTVVCISEIGFQLTIIEQYTVYSFYHMFLGGIYFIVVLLNCFIKTPDVTEIGNHNIIYD